MVEIYVSAAHLENSWGWAYIEAWDGVKAIEAYGRFPHCSDKDEAALFAIVMALTPFDRCDDPIVVYTDSAYVSSMYEALNNAYADKALPEPVVGKEYADLWKRLMPKAESFKIAIRGFDSASISVDRERLMLLSHKGAEVEQDLFHQDD